MTDIRKFLTDVEKTKKITRQNNSGNYDYYKAADSIRKLFNRSTSCPTELPDTIFGYWENEYVLKNPDLQNEPSQENLDKLAAMLAFLDNSEEFQEVLTEHDWQELKDLVSYEADDLPVNLLQDLMMILVSKGAY